MGGEWVCDNMRDEYKWEHMYESIGWKGTDFRLTTWASSAESMPLSLRFRGWGLETSEQSLPLTWQGMQLAPSSSSLLMTHLVLVRRQS